MFWSVMLVLGCHSKGGDADSGAARINLIDATDSGSATDDGDADTDIDADTDVDTDTDTDSDADGDEDGDGDGWTPNEGDCDDGNAEVNPGATSDDCDGLDNDCDGTTDEDFAGDSNEPNDIEATDLGSLADYDEETVVLNGYISPAHDVDVFRLYVDDGWFDWFTVEVLLTTVPRNADLAIELVWVEDSDGASHGTVAEADEGGIGEDEFLSYDSGISGIWSDTAGIYEVVVYSKEGHGCEAPYELTIAETGLLVGR